MKRIYVVRHGQTFINRYNKMQGWCDTPLTEEGIAGAKRTGEVLKNIPFDIALSSDLKRAFDTCELIMSKNVNRDLAQHLAYPYFREQFYGYFEGMDSEMAWQMIGGPHGYPDRHELLRKESIDTIKDWIKEADPYHDAENAQEYWKRIDQGFKLIRQLDGAENILLVTHGFTIRSLVDHYGQQFDKSASPQNGSISIMEMDEQSQKFVSFNQMKL
ncbi:MAG: histidine phosphatase family protein [Lactobacillus sp.]|nr:histidine phosphatase family protein [Lactobacillus sp.]